MRKFERSYLYYLNQRGHLYHIFDVAEFLRRSLVPTGPAFLREETFLDFFFQRLQPNPEFFASNVADQDLLRNTCWSNPRLPWCLSRHRSAPPFDLPNDDANIPAGASVYFPWMSVCGTKEVNYLVAEDAPVVFHDLQWCDDMKDMEICRESMALFEATRQQYVDASVARDETAIPRGTQTPALIFGGTLRQPFSPGLLCCSKDGMLYHPVAHHLPRRAWRHVTNGSTQHQDTVSGGNPDGFLLGLLAPQVCVKLGIGFVADASRDDGEDAYQIEWLGEVHRIPFLRDT